MRIEPRYPPQDEGVGANPPPAPDHALDIVAWREQIKVAQAVDYLFDERHVPGREGTSVSKGMGLTTGRSEHRASGRLMTLDACERARQERLFEARTSLWLTVGLTRLMSTPAASTGRGDADPSATSASEGG